MKANLNKYDVLLSILLGKIVVIYIKLKYRLSNISNAYKVDDNKLMEQIFEAIDCFQLLSDVISNFQDDILIEISNVAFYNFIPFIKWNTMDNSYYKDNNEYMLSFVELLFPVLTSKSQISIIETCLADVFLWIETKRFKSFIAAINWPYFTLLFLKKKLIENIGKTIKLMDHENPLFELMYWFEDFLIGDFDKLHLTKDHIWLNQKTAK